jgi:hypothetical protein
VSQAAAQASMFYEEVANKKIVWTIKDNNGFPAPMNRDGVRTMPFWSSERRVKTIIKEVPAYHSFQPFKIKINDFYEHWLPGLAKDRLLLGVNWSGKNALGYDIDSETAKKNIDYYIEKNGK